MENKTLKVINRSGSRVVYRIPEMNNLRREFMPGEPRYVSSAELEALSYQPGGRELICHYLLIEDADVLDNLSIPVELEYSWTEKDIIDLFNNGSLDSFKDALDFAPIGVKQLIKDLAVQLPLNDSSKREAMQQMWGFNVDAAIRNDRADKAAENAPAPASRRRASTTEAQPKGGRRESKYSVKE